MKRALALFIALMMLLMNTAFSESPVTYVFALHDGMKSAIVGTDIPAGEYTASLDETSLTGTPLDQMVHDSEWCIYIVRKTDGEYKIHNYGIYNGFSESPVIAVENGDLLSVASSFPVLLTIMIQDQYPCAIEGVNLSKAIADTISHVKQHEDYSAISTLNIAYDESNKAIVLEILYSQSSPVWENDVYSILQYLNNSCRAQNADIPEAAGSWYGDIYDDLHVFVKIMGNVHVGENNEFILLAHTYSLTALPRGDE